MALKDTPNPTPSLIDPETGEPYQYGSPGYQAAILPFIEKQIGAQSQEAANARGTLYSGSAMADEIQARVGALNQMAQLGASQSLQEKELAQQEAFQEQLQHEQNQANADISSKNAKAGMTAAAVQGGTGALGTLGGMAAYKALFGGGANAMGTQLSNYHAAVQAGYAPAEAAKMAGLPGGVPPGAAPGMSDAVSAGNAGALPADYAGWNGGAMAPAEDFNFATAGTGAPPEMGIGDALMTPGTPSVGGALMALPAAYYGSKAGQRTFGDSTASKVGSGVGGAAGFGLGSLIGGPAGGAAGAGVGSFLGADWGVHPGDAMAPWLAMREIPGVRNAMAPVGNAAHDVGDWFSSRLGL